MSILLVDKDRQVLCDAFQRLGQSALDHSKDKFLVQSCEVPDSFAAQFLNQPRLEGNQYRPDLVEALTRRWNAVAAEGGPVYNKKLHIRHVADAAAAAGTALPAPLRAADRGDAQAMSPAQLREEAAALRRKYDELVAFSVNLTAERDVLNNTLEQTKRDLNRERASRTALERAGAGAGAEAGRSKGAGGGLPWKVVLATLLASVLLGISTANAGSGSVWGRMPVVSRLLGFEPEPEEGE